MSKNTKTTLVSAVLISSVLLSGCGLFGGEEKKKIDPPQQVSLEEDESKVTGDETEGTDVDGNEDAVEETVMTELYLIDENGYVVSQTLALPKKEGVATQALEYLVKGGPVTDMLPNGFRAVIPEDTKLSVNIKDGVATVDFSKEFKNYQAEDEKKILEAVTWTLTQFDSVDKVKLQLNGEPLEAMPVNGLPVGEELSRADGINMDTSNIADITNTKPLTVYYIGGNEDSYYYVPVTKRVSKSFDSNIEAVVNELVKGPGYTSNLITEFFPEVELLEKPSLKDGEVVLNFNESIYNSFEEKIISQHLLNSLVLSLTEQSGIQTVSILVDGSDDIVNDKGEKLTEPVSRPEKVNTGRY